MPKQQKRNKKVQFLPFNEFSKLTPQEISQRAETLKQMLLEAQAEAKNKKP